MIDKFQELVLSEGGSGVPKCVFFVVKKRLFLAKIDKESPKCTEGVGAYLIFVIFFTRAKFLENKIYTEKR